MEKQEGKDYIEVHTIKIRTGEKTRVKRMRVLEPGVMQYVDIGWDIELRIEWPLK